MRCSHLSLALFLITSSLLAQRPTLEHFTSNHRSISYDIFPATTPDAPILIILPGSSGPSAPLYQSEAAWFAQHGFRTLLLHFFDADSSRSPNTDTYTAWASALADLVEHLRTASPAQPRFVLGFSLGASVALAAGSQQLPVAAIAEWYGSLPDDFFANFAGMPPLLILHGALDTNIPVLDAQQLIRLCTLKQLECDNHIYPGEQHGFTPAALADANTRTLTFFLQHAEH